MSEDISLTLFLTLPLSLFLCTHLPVFSSGGRQLLAHPIATLPLSHSNRILGNVPLGNSAHPRLTDGWAWPCN